VQVIVRLREPVTRAFQEDELLREFAATGDSTYLSASMDPLRAQAIIDRLRRHPAVAAAWLEPEPHAP
jgi:hypothetical protein